MESKFNIDILNKLAQHHKQLMKKIELQIDSFNSDKDIYDYITDYYNQHNLAKAFPVGISINQIVAHNSYHPANIIKLQPTDIIKIDFGFIEQSNIIDSARTFVYKGKTIKAICDAKMITKKIEDYIRTEIETKGQVNIQRISVLSNALIVANGYNSLGLIGGHSIELDKVHGKKLILNKPLTLLPDKAKDLIDINWTLTNEEMFAIEIYLPESKTEGELIQNINIPITHYELNKCNLIELKNLSKSESELESESESESKTYYKLKEKTKGLVYEHFINDEFEKKIINELIRKNCIIKHYPLEFKSFNTKLVKYIQYEDCFLIKNNKLINLLD